jgi:hypothetical protein
MDGVPYPPVISAKAVRGMNERANPDMILSAAAALSMSISFGRAQTRYKSLPLDAFDAAQLTGSDPSAIARFWLEDAGCTGRQPQL